MKLKDSGFARFNSIITSLKALDEGFSSKNYVRKFLRALHPKWRAKVTAIKESKDLSSLALDELIGNLKVHEIVMEKDSEIYKSKKERIKSIALKAKKESSDDETLTSGSDDEEYAMAKGKSDRKCFRCSDPNHLIGDCPKPSRNKDQKAFIGGSLSDSKNDAEDKTNDETCLMAQSSNEVCLRTCLEPDEWIKDSGCSKHMTGNKSLFSTYKAYEGGNVVFGSNLKGKIIGKGRRNIFLINQELNFFLGLQINQMEDRIFFNQSKYIKEMLKKFGLEDSKPTKTPMSTEIKLTKDDEADSVDSSKYQGMIGSLLYSTASMPDIMFSVCLCACFQENPKTAHLEAIKRIFRYIRGTSHLRLWYLKGTRIETIVYADSDHAGDYVDRKSTSGICTFMGCCLTSWFAKKQTTLAIRLRWEGMSTSTMDETSSHRLRHTPRRRSDYVR
ncbi:copia protein [Tanacetum coccineum]